MAHRNIAALTDSLGLFWMKYCSSNDIDLKSEFSQTALTVLVDRIKVLVKPNHGDIKVAIRGIVAQFEECRRLGLKANATIYEIEMTRNIAKMNLFGERKEVGAATEGASDTTTYEVMGAEFTHAANEAAETMARQLVEEEEEDKRACATKAARNRQKKKAAKARKKCNATFLLTSVNENEASLQDNSADYVEQLPVAQAADFVHLGDMMSALEDTNDDAATSVATALQCVVCMANERAVACVPCGHKCLCEECSNDTVLRSKKCPMCRADVHMFLRVYE